jgi:hypothetical protein
MVITNELLHDIRDETQDRINTTFTYGAVGDDNTAPTAGDTELASEVFRKARATSDTSVPGKIIVSLELTSAEANGNDLKEFGWLNASTLGTLWTRNILTSVTKTSDITLYLDTSITIKVEEE